MFVEFRHNYLRILLKTNAIDLSPIRNNKAPNIRTRPRDDIKGFKSTEQLRQFFNQPQQGFFSL